MYLLEVSLICLLLICSCCVKFLGNQIITIDLYRVLRRVAVGSITSLHHNGGVTRTLNSMDFQPDFHDNLTQLECPSWVGKPTPREI